MFTPSVYSWHVFNQQDDFKQLLLQMATRFVSVSPQDFDLVVNEALETLGRVIKVDRLYVYYYDFENQFAFNTHEWCVDSIPALINNGNLIPFAKLTDIKNLHRQGKAVFIPNIYIPEDELENVLLFEKNIIKSIALFPMLHKGECLGFIGSDLIRESRDFSESDLFILKALSEMLTCAELCRRSENERLDLESKYVDLVEQTSDWVWEVDKDICFTYANKQVEAITGYSPAEILGKTTFSFMDSTEIEKAKSAVNDFLLNGKPFKQLGNIYKHKNGRKIYLETSGIPIFNAAGKVKGFRGISRDVTTRIINERKLAQMSMRDSLTGLYNRAYFEEELKRLANSRQYPITVIYADINNLKLVNDAYGHDKGDDLLKAAAAVLRYSLRRPEALARIGGDEFAAVMINTGEEGAESIVKRIRDNTIRFNNKNQAINLGLSIGFATAKIKGASLTDLLKRADDMMYRDKILQSRGGGLEQIDKFHTEITEKGLPEDRHANRLARMCRALGQRLSLSGTQLSNLTLLAKTHNLGETGIPKKILLKQGRLNAEEQNIMRLHPEKGYRIALSSSELLGIAELILKHHEWWDGNGYPLGLQGNAIPIECRILAVTEAFLTLVLGGEEVEALSNTEALEELKKTSGTQFDPSVVKAIFLLYDEVKKLKAQKNIYPASI